MAEEKLSDVIAGLIYCALKPESLGADDFHRYMDAYNQVRSREECGENVLLTVSKIDAPESTPGVVQNGHKKGGVAAWREGVQKQLLSTRFSTQQIAEAGMEDKLTVEEIRSFAMGAAVIAHARVKAIKKAMDRLEGRT